MSLKSITAFILITLSTQIFAHDHAWWPVDVTCEDALDMAHEKCASWDDFDQDHSYDVSCIKAEMKKYDFNYSDYGLTNPSREARPFYNEFFCHSGY